MGMGIAEIASWKIDVINSLPDEYFMEEKGDVFNQTTYDKYKNVPQETKDLYQKGIDDILKTLESFTVNFRI